MPASGCLSAIIFFPSTVVRFTKPIGALFGYRPICLALRIPFAVFNARLVFSASGTER